MEFIKGMDLSSLKEVEECGGKFFDNGSEKNAIDILQSYGMNSVRLRLWNNPYTEEGKPYGGGSNDIKVTIELAKRCLAHNMGFLLDFHYSDFWSDPGKQYVPKSWQSFDVEELEKAVYDYTVEVLRTLHQEEAYPTMIQIGNEVSNGLLWPMGKTPNYDNIARFINAGIRAVRSLDQEIPIMIHLDNGGNNKLYREWFDHFMEKGEDFQIIGLSYYPFWHGSLDELSNNMNDIAIRYGKELIIAEVSMGYTIEDYGRYEKLEFSERKGMATKGNLLDNLDYPMTKEGQRDFMKDVMDRLRAVPNNLGKGFYYWEPAWIPVPGSSWAYKEGMDYVREPGLCGNEWANQALFDYDGNALPTLELIRVYM